MKLIVGLGNPGEKYKKTRHNIGFEILNAIALRLDTQASWKKDALSHAEILLVKYNSTDIALAKPLTFMNNSGQAVSSLLGKYKLAPSDLIVVHDELDLPLGEIKQSNGGSSAGHNGIQSIIDTIKTENFTRIRCGIGKPEQTHASKEARADIISNYVLSPFRENEHDLVKTMIEDATSLLILAFV